MQRNKKAQLSDAVTSSVGIAMFVMVIICGLIFLYNFNVKAQASSEFSTASKNFISDGYNSLLNAWNWGILFVYIAFLISSVIFAYKVRTDIATIVYAFILIFFIVIIVAIPANIYSDAQTLNSNFSYIAEQMPITDYIMDHLVEAAIIYFGIVGYVLFTRRGAG